MSCLASQLTLAQEAGGSHGRAPEAIARAPAQSGSRRAAKAARHPLAAPGARSSRLTANCRASRSHRACFSSRRSYAVARSALGRQRGFREVRHDSVRPAAALRYRNHRPVRRQRHPRLHDRRLGLARRRLRIRQLYLKTMAAEQAMLEAFASWLQPDTTLVSYNGRCYDSPLLATRYRLARMANPLAGLRHLDLLFPVRRRFRGVWENCRLATVERQWLGVIREDDLPGSEAPRAWLDYLRGGSARNLRRVHRTQRPGPAQPRRAAAAPGRDRGPGAGDVPRTLKRGPNRSTQRVPIHLQRSSHGCQCGSKTNPACCTSNTAISIG